jgi:hypothetical protein
MGAQVIWLPNVQVIIGGYRIEGWGEEGFKLEPDEADMEKVTGADGLSAFARSSNTDWTATFSLMPNSPSYRRIMLLRDEQFAGTTSGQIDTLNFRYFNPMNGDTITGQLIFLTRPGMAAGKSIEAVEITASLTKVRARYGSTLVETN